MDNSLRNICDFLLKDLEELKVEGVNIASFINSIIANLSNLVEGVKMVLNIRTTPENGPSASTFSISQLQGVYTSIELLWSLKVQNYLNAKLDNVDLFADLLYPKSFIVTKDRMEQLKSVYVKSDSNSLETSYLYTLPEVLSSVKLILSVCRSHVFSNLMLPRFVRRLLIVLLCLHHDINQPTYTDLQSASLEIPVLISGLIEDGGSLVFSQLRVVSISGKTNNKSLSWLHTEICNIFRARILAVGGLEVVLTGLLEGVTDGPHSHQLQTIVVRFIFSLISKSVLSESETFLQSVSKQLSALFATGVANTDVVLMRLCVDMMMKMALLGYSTAESKYKRKYIVDILQELVAPILIPIGITSSNLSVASADDVKSAIKRLHILLYMSPISPSLMRALHESCIGKAIMHLYCFISLEAKTYELFAMVKECCEFYIKNISVSSEGLDDVVWTVFLYNKYSVRGNELIELCPVFSRTDSAGIAVCESGAVRSKEVAVPTTMSPIAKQSKSSLTDEQFYGIVHNLNVNLNAEEKEESAEDLMKLFNFDSLQNEAVAELFMYINGVAERIRSLIPLMVSVSNNSSLFKKGGSSEAICGELLPSIVFVSLLQSYFDVNSINECDCKAMSILRQIKGLHIILGIVVVLLRELIPIEVILLNGLQILNLLFVFISSFSNKIDCNVKAYMKDEGDLNASLEMLKTAFNLLLVICTAGNQQRTSSEEDSLRKFIPILQEIVITCANKEKVQQILNMDLQDMEVESIEKEFNECSEVALEIVTIIMTRSTQAPTTEPLGRYDITNNDYMTSLSEIENNLTSAADASVIAFELSNIPKLLNKLDNHLSNANLEQISNILIPTLDLIMKTIVQFVNGRENIHTFDSFSYLSCIHLVRKLSDVNRGIVLEHLLNLLSINSKVDLVEDSLWKRVFVEPRNKIMILEAISRIVDRAGEVSGSFGNTIIRCCLPFVRNKTTTNNSDVEIDILSKMKVSMVNENEVSDQSIKNFNDQIHSAEMVLLRQAALSLIAICISASQSTVAAIECVIEETYLLEVIDVVVYVFLLENSGKQESISVRRSATFCLRSLIIGLKKSLVQDYILCCKGASEFSLLANYVEKNMMKNLQNFRIWKDRLRTSNEGITQNAQANIFEENNSLLSKIECALRVALRDTDKVVRHHADVAFHNLEVVVMNEFQGNSKVEWYFPDKGGSELVESRRNTNGRVSKKLIEVL